MGVTSSRITSIMSNCEWPVCPFHFESEFRLVNSESSCKVCSGNWSIMTKWLSLLSEWKNLVLMYIHKNVRYLSVNWNLNLWTSGNALYLNANKNWDHLNILSIFWLQKGLVCRNISLLLERIRKSRRNPIIRCSQFCCIK